MNETERPSQDIVEPRARVEPEFSTETTRIMETAARERLDIFIEYLREALGNIYRDPSMQKFLNMSPIIGDAIRIPIPIPPRI